MKYYLLAGEASGDLHGANLIKELKKKDAQADIKCWGGDLMQEAGATLELHYKERAFMGFFEVLKNLLNIVGLIRSCKKDIARFKPDVVILIDNSGFNLRIAPFVKSQGIKVVYYISPQLWASRSSRIKAIKKYIDEVYVVLPFVKEFYSERGYESTFVGHPLLDAIAEKKYKEETVFRQENQLSNKPLIALLPGSRTQEINKILSIMLSVVSRYPDFEFVIAGAPSQEEKFYAPWLNQQVKIIHKDTYNLLKYSQVALVASGTATLEAALFGLPQVVCYRTKKIEYCIARKIVNLKYISLVNLIMDQEIVKELIQDDLTKEHLEIELDRILDSKHREILKKQYLDLKEKLGGEGASERTANLIVQSLT